MPDLDQCALEIGAAVVDHGSVLREDRPAARPAVHVALVRRGEMRVVDPLHGVGLALPARLAFGEDQRAALVGRIDPLELHRPGREMRQHRAVARDDDHVVVLLQAHHDFAERVDVDEFRLRILGRDLGQAGEIDLHQALAIGEPVRNAQQGKETRRHLAEATVACILVPLVLDRDGDEAAVLGDGDGIGLPAEIAGGLLLPGAEVQHHQPPRGIGVALGGVHADEGRRADDGDRGRLPAHLHGAERFRPRGIGDVDQADRAERAVGVDQRHAVLRRGDDFGAGFARAVLALGHVVGGREAGDAVEGHLGLRRPGDQGQKRGGQRQMRFHVVFPLRYVPRGGCARNVSATYSFGDSTVTPGAQPRKTPALENRGKAALAGTGKTVKGAVTSRSGPCRRTP